MPRDTRQDPRVHYSLRTTTSRIRPTEVMDAEGKYIRMPGSLAQRRAPSVRRKLNRRPQRSGNVCGTTGKERTTQNPNHLDVEGASRNGSSELPEEPRRHQQNRCGDAHHVTTHAATRWLVGSRVFGVDLLATYKQHYILHATQVCF